MLGNGNVARAPATGWAAAGHDVAMGSRRPKDGEGPGPAVVGPSEATRTLTGCAPTRSDGEGAPVVTSC
ncbi:hypothetical protein [Streptomyces sp. NPDC050804]|uniref:hypothetical protein n=1 Tax=Streptomyces sp. NPDC050804 TaxID=3154745 RepID=UPI00342D29DF